MDIGKKISMDVHSIFTKFKSEKSCHDYIISKRWSSGVSCPFCNAKKVYRRNTEQRFKCSSCHRSFSVYHGTIFHASRLPLSKWFLAISIILSAKKGVSSLQLARVIGVNKNTAWYIQMRLRRAMQEDLTLKGLIEIDEAYMGGKLSNKHFYKKKKKKYHKSGMVHMTPVLGMLQRKGNIIVTVLKHPSGEHIKPILKEKIDPKSSIVTDGFGGYYGINAFFQKHIRINRTKYQRKWGRYHTNSIEGFWALLKRSVIGQYHKISEVHLQDYLNEICFKFNNRNNNLFEILINRACATL